MSKLLLIGCGSGSASVAGGGPLDGISGLQGAWSFSRDLRGAWGGAPRYTEDTGKIDAFKDQSGNARDLLQTTAARRPVIGTGGPLSRACGVFNSSDITYLTTAAGDPLSDFIDNNAYYLVASFIGDTINSNQANIYENEGIASDTGLFFGTFLKTGDTVNSYNWDGTADTSSIAVTEDTAYVVEMWHTGGNLHLRLNGAGEVSTASGNTTTLTGLFRIGNSGAGNSAGSLDGVIFEVAIFDAVPDSTTRDAIMTSFKDWIGA